MDIDLKAFVLKIEELIFEIFVTVVFYPATMWGVLRRPLSVFNEVFEGPQEMDEGSVYIYPFILYVLTCVLSAMFAPVGSDVIAHDLDDNLKAVINLNNGLAITALLRGFIYLPFFLTGALLVDLFTPGKITRRSLRIPFSKFCYLSSPHMLLTSVSVFYMDSNALAAHSTYQWLVGAVFGAAQLWYLVAVYGVFVSYGCGRRRSAFWAVGTFMVGWIFSVGTLLLFTKRLI